MLKGFVRITAAVPPCLVTHFEANAAAHIALWQQAEREASSIVIFPELGLSSYTARDLLSDHHLLESCLKALGELVEASKALRSVGVFGLPVRIQGGIYNVAAVIQSGKILGLVPKSYLPNYREFEEARWFRPGVEVPAGSVARVLGQDVPFGTDLLFDAGDELVLGLEICEDYWVHVPPSAWQVGAGATIIANLSASNFTVGKAELRRLLARSASDRGKSAYLYVAAGPGESSTDLAFDADAFICENGAVLAESTRFARQAQLVSADIDLERLLRERATTNSFGDCSRENRKVFRRIPMVASAEVPRPIKREVAAHPFLPRDPKTLATRCWEIFEIQSNALATRMKAARAQSLVLGVSGGLDSTHAALVCAQALDLLGLPRDRLHAITMPGLGTTVQTRGNAEKLTDALGARFRCIPISDSARQVLAEMDHPAARGTSSVEDLLARLRAEPALGDVAFENSQARLRTLLLMTIANQHHGLVVGTGDLSEKALGWSTYSGDHISNYDVNAGVPKTLIQFVIKWVANERAQSWSAEALEGLRTVLFDILDTPISPELLPSDAEGKIAQLTEDVIGPYELHDFYLYHFAREGARPERILDLAQIAFGACYDLATHKRWLSLFFRRFFQNQFKRSCTADGPKVGMVALSPRGDWRMPSDAQVDSWLEAIAAYGEA